MNCSRCNDFVAPTSRSGLGIELVLTHACNFRCTYCYERNSRDTSVVSKQVVEEFPNLIRKLYNQYPCPITITWFGGEPTLRSEDVTTLTQDLAKETYTNFYIITNGYNIDGIKSILTECRDTYGSDKFRVQVSYDCSPVQELSRLEAISLDGNKAKQRVLQNINWLAENRINFNLKSTLGLKTLQYFDKAYFDYVKLYKELTEKYGTIVNNSPMRITLDTDCEQLPEEELETILIDFRKAMLNALEYQIKTGDNSVNWLFGEVPLCSTGYSMLAVDVDGSLYPCHGAIFSRLKNELRYKKNIFNVDVARTFKKNLYGADLKTAYPNHDCVKCTTSYCARCDIHCFERSTFKSYNRRMIDFSNNRTYCRVMREISNFIYAKRKYMSDAPSPSTV